MRWTRRAFMSATGAATLLLCVGGFAALNQGRATFSDNRALPGTRVQLTLDAPNPHASRIHLVAIAEGHARILETLDGADVLDILVPAIETVDESYTLLAVIDTEQGRFQSDTLEVLAQPFAFGI